MFLKSDPVQGFLVAVSAAVFSLSAPATVSNFDWCSVEVPDKVELGKGFQVKVTLKKALPEGQNLSCQMHHSRSDGSWGGQFEWRPPQAPAAVGQPTVFQFTCAKGKNAKELVPVVFAAPDGNWEQKGWIAWPAHIHYPLDPAAEAALAAATSIPADWCEVSVPKSVSRRSGILLSITPKPGVPDGLKLSAQIHWEGHGKSGFLGWTEPKISAVGKPAEFSFNVGIDEAKVERVRVLAFISADGDFGHALKVRRDIAIPVVSAVANDYGWCTIDMPKEIGSGDTVVFKVTPRAGIPAGQKLCVNLHWSGMKQGGFLAWNPPQDGVAGQAATYTFANLKLADKIQNINPIVFLAPDGDFNKKSREARCDGIPVKVDPAVLAAQAKEAARLARPASATFKKSFLRILPVETSPVKSGEPFTVKVAYHLEPGDNWGDGTSVTLTPLGPWIDNPDGVYNKDRHHASIPGLSPQTKAVQNGDGVLEFTFKIASTGRYADFGLMAQYIGGDHTPWPWSTRGGGPAVAVDTDKVRFETDALGGLFLYGQTPRIKVIRGNGAPDTKTVVAFKVFDTTGTEVLKFDHALAGTVEIPGLKTRGTCLVQAEIPGVGVRDATFATIPDVAAVIGKKSTPFGVTDVSSPDVAKIARLLGASWCRLFTGWGGFEPQRGQYDFKGLDRTVDQLNAEGIRPWIMVIGPPAWAIPDPAFFGAGYCPFPFDEAAWARTAGELAKHYRGRVRGFEWQNEIVPGSMCKDPVRNYIDFCRLGTTAVKAVAPEMKILLAGGLWPKNFRTDLVNAGVCQYIDELPIHYGNADGILQAHKDALAGEPSGRVTVSDDETATGLSTLGMPGLEAMTKSVVQCQSMMRNWPGELTAGATCVVYFGGSPNAAGNWTYLLDMHTPRPVAATYAVLSSKIGLARPVGATTLCAAGQTEPLARLDVFEAPGGKGVALVGALSEKSSATVAFPVFSSAIGRLLLTDHQGNESSVAVGADGVCAFKATPISQVVEGFDFHRVALLTSLDDVETVNLPEGAAGVVRVHVKNPFADQSLRGTLAVTVGRKLGGLAVVLKPGESRWFEVPLAPADAGGNGTVELVVKDAVVCVKPVTVRRVNIAELGNLLKNGTFEKGRDGWWWSGDGKLVDFSENKPGLTGKALKFEHAKGWAQANQGVKVPAGCKSLLYTAWLWNKDMEAGSNLGLGGKDGSNQTAFMPQVFTSNRQGAGFWRLMTHHRDVSKLSSVSFTPVCSGAGFAIYDNMRVTLDEGTDFMGEAPRLAQPVKIDGKPDEWNFAAHPLPLLCVNQLTAEGGYKWSPENLSGVATCAWDEKGLYLAAWVRDDVHQPAAAGSLGDSLAIALHPANRREGTEGQAFQLYLSDVNPGGGSGKYTLCRPAERAGGRKSGQLAKDSSVFDIAIGRSGDCTTYELFIPWAEVGAKPVAGLKLGLSLQLDDGDGTAAHGRMNWGAGLTPVWAPSAFGVLTLID